MLRDLLLLVLSLSTLADALSRADCYLGYDKGPCFQSILQYYYNADRGQCTPFLYGGCQGNANRFDSKAACETACLSASSFSLYGSSSSSSSLNAYDDDYESAAFPPTAKSSSAIVHSDQSAAVSVSSPPLAGSPTFWSCTTPRDNQQPPAQFWMRSSFFHIFRNLKVVCSGAAYKWQVVSRVGYLDGLYLAVWRPLQTGKAMFKLIGTTRVSQMAVKPDVWTDITIKDRFTVAPGDLIGFFYDSWLYTDSSSSIPLMSGTNTMDLATKMLTDETYVAQLQASDIFNSTSATVDMSGAVKVSRRPAVALIVDPTGSSRTPSEIPAVTNKNGNNNYTDVTAGISFSSDGRASSCLDAFRMAGACNYDITSFKTRWYFDQPDGRCEMFWYYPDCVVSANIFMTKDACEKSCRFFFNSTTPKF